MRTGQPDHVSKTGLSIFSIAAHRGFADALAAGLLSRFADPRFGLARLTLLLPGRRAMRTVTDAFVRLSGNGSASGLLLPRMAVIGDIDLDETLGPLIDPIDSGTEVPPATDPMLRRLRLATLLHDTMVEEGASTQASTSSLLRQARDMAAAMDRMLIEGLGPEELVGERVVGIVKEQAGHWLENLRIFAKVQRKWLAELDARGEVDAPAQRNALFDHVARRWRADPPRHPVVAAGITSASPSIAMLLRVVAALPRGAVVLPDLDLSLGDEVWDELGRAGHGENADDAPLGPVDAVTHPQYHLKLLLNRMGVARAEVRPWHRAGRSAAPPERSRAISNLFLPPEQSASWVGLPPERRRLAGVRLMETAHPEEEAQAIAILIREALEEPERTVALITPDRSLAGRVIAHLERWDIAADDTAGEPLPQTAAGRMALLLAEVLAQHAAPVPLVAALSHPLAGNGEDRAQWLDHARVLDKVLRGPRLDAGLNAVERVVMKETRRRDSSAMAAWWKNVAAAIAPLVALGDGETLELASGLSALTTASEGLCGEAIWSDADGRALSAFLQDLAHAATSAPVAVAPAELPNVLRDMMEEVAVRRPYGGHPRLAIYGLIEARMSRADLAICGGLIEGTWPRPAVPDPLIAPPVLRALGIPGADFRIGLAAHDLAAALGAPEVVLSHARRDATGPTIASRFVLRVKAMLGDQLDRHREVHAPALAARIDKTDRIDPHPRPAPDPQPERRRVELSATALDRLRSDPYQFYAQTILRLRPLDPLDQEPTPAWKGTAVHSALERWWKEHDAAPGTLEPLAERVLNELSNHPLMRGLWRPRLLRALEWVDAETQALQLEGRNIVLAEQEGAILVDGVKIKAKADRIDRLGDGSLAIVDYKTGTPPSASMVEQGFALQLGTTGLVAAGGGFDGVEGLPVRFEYWSLGRSDDGFGYRSEPVLEGRKRSGIPRERFLEESERFLREAIGEYIVGRKPFVARLNPDLASYNDYDQLMRLDEWFGREGEA